MRGPRVDGIVLRLLFIIRKRARAGNGRARCSLLLSEGGGAMDQIAGVDRALDEMLVQLGGMVLRLSSPDVTRAPEERRALACSVNQYAVCAARSGDPRVHQLKVELEETIKPHLRLVASR
jgi:hypothetical protein